MNDGSPTDPWACPSYDEAFDRDGRPRPAYAALARKLGWDPLHPPGVVVHHLSGQPLGDDHRMIPVPLAMDDLEYRSKLQAGIAQRAQALQMFYADVVLGDGRFLRSGTALTRTLLDEILASEHTSLAELQYHWNGHGHDDIRFVYGPDLARAPNGQWVVLEDNVGCVGGCADSFYVFDAYSKATGLAPRPLLDADLNVAISRWLESLHLSSDDPGVIAMLSDRDYLDNHLPLVFKEDARRERLVQHIGIRIATDDDLDHLCKQSAAGSPQLKALINVGVPSTKQWTLMLTVAFAQLRVPILNAPGTSILGNKALLPFVTEMVEFYCQKDAILQNPPTMLLRDGQLPEKPEEWVVKTAAGCQGSGVYLLRFQGPDDLAALRKRLEGSWPTGAAIAQRHIELSHLWMIGPRGIRTYRVEVRPLAYVLGWHDIFSGEQGLGKLATGEQPGSLNNIAHGGSYVPIIRQPYPDERETDSRKDRLQGSISMKEGSVSMKVTEKNFTKQVLEADVPVLVAFRANWCEASKQLAPVIDGVMNAYKGRAHVVTVDIGDDDPRVNKVCQRYKVNRLPAVLLFNEGRMKDLMGGMPSQSDLTQMIDRQIQPVRDVGEHNFRQEVLESKVPVLVHFHSKSCDQSQALIPLTEALAGRFQKRAKVVRVELDAFNAALCARYGAVRFPMIGAFQDGEMRDSIMGAGSEQVSAEDGSLRKGEDHVANMLEPLCW
jgi:thioredoxin-like negative regulator of GroEL